MITLPVFDHAGQLVLWIIVTLLMPMLVGLVTKQSTAAYWKSALLLALGLINGVVTEWAATYNNFDWRRAIAAAVIAWAVAVAGHFGIWKPTGASDAAQNTGVKDAKPVAPYRAA